MKLFAFILILSLNISIGSTKYIEELVDGKQHDESNSWYEFDQIMAKKEENEQNLFEFMDGETKPTLSSMMPPSYRPSYKPSMMPPSYRPSYKPSMKPPSYQPSNQPSYKPSMMPPSYKPSYRPSYKPSMMSPSYQPTMMPPSYKPSYKPSVMPPSYKPSIMQPSYRPSYQPSQKPGPEIQKIPAKFMIISLANNVGDLFFTMQTLEEVQTQFGRMKALPKPQKNGMMPPSGLVNIAISQLQQVYWGMRRVEKLLKNKMSDVSNKLSSQSADQKDEKKPSSYTNDNELEKLYDLLKKASEGEVHIEELKKVIENAMVAAPQVLKRLKRFGEMLKVFEKLENHKPNKMNTVTPPIRSLVKLTSVKMEQMFWTMIMIKKMKMAWKKGMMSGDNNEQNEKEIKMKVGFMKMSMLRLTDTYWTMKNLKGMIEEEYEEKVGPIGTEQPKLPEGPQNHMSDETFFESAKESMWKMHEMLQKCSKAMEEMKEFPMQIEGHMMWERLPVKKMTILRLMNEMIKTTPILSEQMGIFKEKLENTEDEYGEEDHEDK